MKHNTLLLLLTLFTVPGFLQAQHCDSINHHYSVDYLIPVNMIQLDDGSILTQNEIRGQSPHPVTGLKYYWISTTNGLSVTDSITIEAPLASRQLFEKIQTTSKYNNLQASVNYDESNANSTTTLNISLFDDNMNIGASSDILLEDTIVHLPYYAGWLLDSRNDIVVCYTIPTRSETHFKRIGLDGTIKSEKTFSSAIMPVYSHFSDGWIAEGLREYGDNPTNYIYFGERWSNGVFSGWELDTLFNVVSQHNINPTNLGVYPGVLHIDPNQWHPVMASRTGGGYVVVRDITWTDMVYGTGLVRYNDDDSVEDMVWFKPSPKPYETGNLWAVDLLKDGNGGLYFAFQYYFLTPHLQYLAIVKLDEDLNVIWERYGMKAWMGKYNRYPSMMKLLDEGGVAVFGYHEVLNSWNPTDTYGVWMITVNDEGVGTPETEDILRPYFFFPNPVEDQLQIHYSSDITPVQVELYDIQGRLLSTHSNDLENITVEELPAGTYTMRVVMKDGSSFSDKVVKQ